MLNLSLPQNLAHPQQQQQQHVTKLPIELRLRPANKGDIKFRRGLVIKELQKFQITAEAAAINKYEGIPMFGVRTRITEFLRHLEKWHKSFTKY